MSFRGLRFRSESTALPAIVIVGGVISTYQLAGLFGTAIAVTAMLGIAGMIVALRCVRARLRIAMRAALPKWPGSTLRCVRPPMRSMPLATPRKKKKKRGRHQRAMPSGSAGLQRAGCFRILQRSGLFCRQWAISVFCRYGACAIDLSPYVVLQG